MKAAIDCRKSPGNQHKKRGYVAPCTRRGRGASLRQKSGVTVTNHKLLSWNKWMDGCTYQQLPDCSTLVNSLHKILAEETIGETFVLCNWRRPLRSKRFVLCNWRRPLRSKRFVLCNWRRPLRSKRFVLCNWRRPLRSKRFVLCNWRRPLQLNCFALSMCAQLCFNAQHICSESFLQHTKMNLVRISKSGSLNSLYTKHKWHGNCVHVWYWQGSFNNTEKGNSLLNLEGV